MPYIKFAANQLFDGYRMLDNQQVLILREDGLVEAIVPKAEAGEDIRYLSGILSPGFVNCHCHLELSHMKGVIPEHTGLVNFVLQVVKDRHVSESEILAAITSAEDEMLENGIVAVGDICNNTLTIPQKTQQRIRYHNFIEASGFSPLITEQRFQRAVTIFEAYSQQLPPPAASNSIVPHAPYSVSDALLEKIIHFSRNQLMTIHNQESAAENELFLHKEGEFLRLYEKMQIDASSFHPSGKTSLQTCFPKFPADQPLILVHNVFTSAADLSAVKQWSRGQISQLSWCLCPNANLYISNLLPDIDLLLNNECHIVLGTDSLASNHQLSILSEMQTIRRHFPLLTTVQLLTWATRNGANALQMGSLLGSFEKGKKPGVLLCTDELTAVSRLL